MTHKKDRNLGCQFSATQLRHALPHIRAMWQYLVIDELGKTPAASTHQNGFIMALGNHDSYNMARQAARLYQLGHAKKIIVTGGVEREFHFGDSKQKITKSEAQFMAAVCQRYGVPANDIIIENTSTNTGENFGHTAALLDKKGLCADFFIVVTIPYVTRRAKATGLKNWPNANLFLVGTERKLSDYLKFPFADRTRIINQMVGTFERILAYPEQGFQVAMPVTYKAYHAYVALKKLGYHGDFGQKSHILPPPRRLYANNHTAQKIAKPS